MEWTNDLVLEFINLYEKHPVIWDPKHVNYRYRNDVADAWSDIRKELSVDFSVEALKKKKESLMTTYRTLKKKVSDSARFGAGKEQGYKPTWFAFESLYRFLRGTEKVRPTLNTEGGSDVYQEEDISIDDNSDGDEGRELPAEIVEVNEYDELDRPAERSFLHLKDIRVKKRRAASSFTDVELHRRMKHSALQTIRRRLPRQQEQPDECSLYGQLLATKLRALDKRTRRILTNQIDNLVFDAEIREMD